MYFPLFPTISGRFRLFYGICSELDRCVMIEVCCGRQTLTDGCRSGCCQWHPWHRPLGLASRRQRRREPSPQPRRCERRNPHLDSERSRDHSQRDDLGLGLFARPRRPLGDSASRSRHLSARRATTSAAPHFAGTDDQSNLCRGPSSRTAGMGVTQTGHRRRGCRRDCHPQRRPRDY